MAVGLEAKRAKTARGRRFLRNREAKLVENPRTALILRGQKTSGLVNSVLTDLFVLKKPHSIHFKRHNAVHPFEDITPLEFLAQKNDASLFAFGTHSKKRPHHLVIGRLFDQHILDMFELRILQAKVMAEFAREARGVGSIESKPCLLFQGEWEHSPTLTALRSLLIDFFNGQQVEAISAIGLERVLVFSLAGATSAAVVESSRAVSQPTRVLVRHYAAKLKKSAEGTTPYVMLEEIGPSLDLALGRVQSPAPDLLKAAMTKPTVAPNQPKKTKNISHSRMGGRQGRLHVHKQDLGGMATARMKGLGKRGPGSRHPDADPDAAPGSEGPKRKKRRSMGPGGPSAAP